MHRVTHSIRRITAPEIPTVSEPGRAPRAMNEQDLLNLGLVHLAGDIYSAVVQEESEDGRSWTPAAQLPGVELSRGRPAERYRRVPAPVRAQVMRAEVERTTGTGQARKTATLVVRESEIAPGDVVKRRDLVPHVWAGERLA